MKLNCFYSWAILPDMKLKNVSTHCRWCHQYWALCELIMDCLYSKFLWGNWGNEFHKPISGHGHGQCTDRCWLTAVCHVLATPAPVRSLMERSAWIDRPLPRRLCGHRLHVITSLHPPYFHSQSFELLLSGALHRLSVHLLYRSRASLNVGFAVGHRMTCISTFVGGEETQQSENSSMKVVTHGCQERTVLSRLRHSLLLQDGRVHLVVELLA